MSTCPGHGHNLDIFHANPNACPEVLQETSTTTMLDVLTEHVQSVRNERCSCGWRGDISKSVIDPHNIYQQHREHVVRMLEAAGFGRVTK